MKNQSFIILLTCLILSCWSCSKDNQLETNSLSPKVSALYPLKAVKSSIITIAGENLGLANDNNFLIIDDTILIKSSQCLRWNNAEIKFILPDLKNSCILKIKISQDTINCGAISITESLPIPMIKINAASFYMGSNNRASELPIRQAQLTKSFYIAQTELTQEEWLSVNLNNPSYTKGLDYPLDNISWIDAIKFCNTLSELQGLKNCYTVNSDSDVVWDKTANGYRLPTEAEWEYAAKANQSDSYIDPEPLESYAVFSDNSGFALHTIASLKPNKFGLYDMLGNVWEWCWDKFDENFYASRPNPDIDPSNDAQGGERVARGGSYKDGSLYCRAANRLMPIYQPFFVGIRLVKNAD